jgi:dolichol-phosphate mannosyltransferase
VTAGFKCWRRRALGAIDLDGVAANGYAFQIEMTWRAYRAGLRIVEIPIVFPDRERGASKMSLSIVWEGAWSVLRLRRRG